MKNSPFLYVCLLMLIVLSSQAIKVNHHQSQDYGSAIRILKSERIVMLNGAYPEETNKVTLNTNGSEPVTTFYHIIPADVYNSLVEIKFEVKRVQQKHTIKEVIFAGKAGR